MAIDPATAAAVGNALIKVRQSKIDRGASGEQTFTRPKTIFGKLIGGISGRSDAFTAQEQNKMSPLTSNVVNSLQPNERQRVPVTGGISFGGEAIKRSYLPFYLGAIVLGIFFFMRRKGGRRRR